ncbi:MAG: MinD/ParA family protein [Desulfatiglandaceae bacterium]
MHLESARNNVIDLTGKLVEREDIPGKGTTRLPEKSKARIIAITSGKGGVGKTNIVANLGFALTQLNKKVLIFDADLGLGNLDVLLGLAPKHNISHVAMGMMNIADIAITGPGNMKILPASSGIESLTRLSDQQKVELRASLEHMLESVDIFLIDTGAGISSNVMYFNSNAHEIMVVVSPEPTSITDAYALMKVLHLHYSQTHFKLIVNFAKTKKKADELYLQLKMVTDKFLDISLEYTGYILADEEVKKGVRLQKVVSEICPNSQASRCFATLAKKICNTPATHSGGGVGLI